MQSIYIWFSKLTQDDIFVIGVYGVILALLVLIIIELVKSPKGYEDENGFHYGDKETNKRFRTLSEELAKYIDKCNDTQRELTESNGNLATAKNLVLELQDSNKALKQQIAELAESKLQKKIEELEEYSVDLQDIIESKVRDNTRLIGELIEVKKSNKSLKNELLLRKIEVVI